MKAQGLPMSTIVLIILVVVVLVGVLLFFFTGFGEGETSISEQNIFGRCQEECLKCERGGITATEYAARTIEGKTVDCSNYLACTC